MARARFPDTPPAAVAADPVYAIRPAWPEASLVLLSVVLGILSVLWGLDTPRWINILCPVILSTGLAAGVVEMVRRDRSAVWAPLLWLRLVLIAYSGVGSVVPFFANSETLNHLDAFFTLYPQDMAGYNLMSSLFAFTVIVATWGVAIFGATRGGRLQRFAQREKSVLSALQFGIFALAVALPLRFFSFWLPLLGGSGFSIPNSILILANLSNVAYAVLAFYFLERRSWAIWWVIALVTFEALLGLAAFNKTEALTPIIFLALGLIYQRPTMLRFGGCAAAIVFLYFILTPLVSYGRAVEGLEGAERPHVMRSIATLATYTPGAEQGRGPEDLQGGWARLTYITGGSFAISQYDRGQPGDTFGGIKLSLVPRILFPDKPSTTQPFIDFNVALTGNDRSQSSPGIPAEAYWNFGWPGVIATGLIMGTAYAIWSVYAIAVMQIGAWHLMLVVIIGIRTAIRIDGLVATDFVPMVALGLIAHLGLSMGNRMLRGRRFAYEASGQAAQPGAAIS